MSEKIKWGILGYARIARLSAIPAILKASNSIFYAIASRDEAKLAECRASTPCRQYYCHYADLLADAQIDAVYIPLPNSVHKDWVIAALRAGKHVLCEKPLALNAADVTEMVAVAKETGRTLMEGLMYRYTDRIGQVRQVLESGVLGEIRHINASFRFYLDRANTIKEQAGLGGGALYDVGCYPLSLLDLVTQAEPQEVKVVCHRQNGVDVNLSAVLGYESGLIANLHCGFNAFGRIHTEIIGTDGLLEIPNTYLNDAGELRLTTRSGVAVIPVAESDRFGAEIIDFADAILGGYSPLIGLDESLRIARLMDLVQAGARAA